jgi:hypothetical protein
MVWCFFPGTSALWLSKDDLQDPSSWSSSPLLLLGDIHSNLLVEYNFKEGCTSSESQAHVESNDGISSQDGASQKQEDTSLTIPQLNRLMKLTLCGVRTLPTLLLPSSRHRIRSPFISSACVHPLKISSKPLRSRTVRNSFASVCNNSLSLRVEDSVLHTEMANLESQEEDAPRHVTWFSPMCWLGQIRPHRRVETWSACL